MIKIQRQIHGISMVNVWFAEEPVKDQGIILYKEAKFKPSKAENFDTLVSSLEESEDEIKAHFSKGCKYKVNRALREDITFEILKADEITDEILEEFLTFFEEFWESKNTTIGDKDSLRQEMKEYRGLNALSLAWATVQGEKAVYHTHVFDDKSARLLHSASLFRLKADEEGSNKNIIGMANRALHYKEMLFFKENGLKEYDWGGAGKGEEVASITEFKESFGGEAVTYYDGEQINGIKAKLISGLSNLKQRIR